MWIGWIQISAWWDNVGQQLPCKHTYYLCTMEISHQLYEQPMYLSLLFIIVSFYKQVLTHNPSTFFLLFALLSHAVTFALSVLDCTSKSMTHFMCLAWFHASATQMTISGLLNIIMIQQFSSELVCLMKMVESLWLTEQKILKFCIWLLSTRTSHTTVPLITKITW
jgi:hypothetical protein